jgi:hypothetical protein
MGKASVKCELKDIPDPEMQESIQKVLNFELKKADRSLSLNIKGNDLRCELIEK